MGTTWPFSGREAEVAALRAALLDTTGAGVLVQGEPGVGKSRLLDELAEMLSESMPVLKARPGQAPAVPFGAFAHLLPIRSPVHDVALGAETVLARAGAGTLVLVVDDIHDLDEQSAQLLRALAGSGRMRLLASGTALPESLSALTLSPFTLTPLTDIATLMCGSVDDETARYLAEAFHGDLRLLHELVRAGRNTGVLADGHWKNPPPVLSREPGSLEEALAKAGLLSSLGQPLEAEDVLAGAPRRPEDRARAAFAAARASNLSYGLGRAEEADRVLAIALETVTTPGARQQVMVQRAAAALHRAASREALDLADDAADVTAPDEVTAARIASVQSVAAALTGQSTAALDKVRTGLRYVDVCAEQAPECGPLLEFARSSVWMAVGDLDAAGEETTSDEDPVAHAAARARMLRARGQVQNALRAGWEGARLLRRGHSLFAGPCLGELAHAAALAGDLATARDALGEADRRALPTLRALWFPVALARPWLLVAQGAVGAAVHGLLDAAAAAEALELRPYALSALHDVVRLGAAGVVADRLAQLAEDAEGDLASLCARHAEAAAVGDWGGLIAASFEFEELGMALHAAEAAAQAAEVHWDKQQAAAAGTRAWVLVQRCDQVRTPALQTAAVPDLTRIQYEIAELVAAGNSELDIAEQMSMPPKMVADQLEEICLKLGVSGPERLAVLLSPAV